MALILGTAGHIDHGKTSLVRALTGIDCDRLEEEKRRGITIELGFAWVPMPGGERLGIVDVPGHERFVKNMVAGAAGVDFVMLVIAADEGVMPQTREHLEICSLLGIRHGFVALTKVDMVDADWLELVQEDVRTFLQGTFLEGAPIFPVSSSTGQPASARCILSTQKWPVMTRPTSFFTSSMSVSAQSGVTCPFASDRCSFVAERTMRFLSSHVPSFAGVNRRP